jgi:hypothetical protein
MDCIAKDWINYKRHYKFEIIKDYCSEFVIARITTISLAA